ncbi:hypothetical protein E7X38_24870 [Streptomyces sp. Akac8]|nr:hypothetical protein E7X38_24870 [Streptomyces sp. Akac8]
MRAQFPAPLRGASTASRPGARGTARQAPHPAADGIEPHRPQGRGELRDRSPTRRGRLPHAPVLARKDSRS